MGLQSYTTDLNSQHSPPEIFAFVESYAYIDFSVPLPGTSTYDEKYCMILSGKSIQAKLGQEIVIDPFREEQLNPNSYNLRLHHELMVYDQFELDMKRENTAKKVIIPEEGLLMEQHKLYLGRTLEFTETQGYVPMLEGRSSIGRLGLFVHITAGFGDVGFSGYWTLEMFCVQPIRIYAGVEICQIFYHSIEGDYQSYRQSSGHPGGKYQNNRGIQPSLLYKDFEKR